MKVAVSIPDPVFKRADALARRRRQSRSNLYTEVLREDLQRHETDELTLAMKRAHSGESIDPLLSAVAEQTLRDIEWEK